MQTTPLKPEVLDLPELLVDMPQKPRKGRLLPVLFIIVALMIVSTGILDVLRAQQHAPASKANGTTTATLPAPQMPAKAPTALNMGMPGAPTSLTSLVGPQNAAHVDTFTLVAQPAPLKLQPGVVVPAWTFNGMAPGPTLHVKQGDLVVVNLVNHLSFGVTIHWHGIDVPNAEDGVAGVTQDAVKPGQTFTYRFIAQDPGTYWYHSHQFSYDETTGGLYGTLIVDPAKPTFHADLDYSVSLHEWNAPNNQTIFTIDNTTGNVNKAAQPGQWVRLRIVNTASTPSGVPQLVTLVGAPFEVIALDGHDLNAPQMLHEATLPIASAQRFDLLFQMPERGPVALVTSADNQHYQASPAVTFGQNLVPAALPAVDQKWFDFDTYGQPASDTIRPDSHFDAVYGMVLNNQMGTSVGRMGMTYTINGKSFPDTGMIMLKEGQVVKLHLDNQSTLYHPIHLHGHIFTVLTHNGQALKGSPVHLDTIDVPPHESYDIAFLANNPGIWMLHCHNLLHANWGMDMMVMYNISTPYTVGTQSGNFPD